MEEKKIKQIVKEGYGKVAKGGGCCCGSSTCADDVSKKLGYSAAEIESAPEGANLGLGCGNPTSLAGLKEGEVVLDLGSGAGFDAFLAARKVGSSGKVIGVDMTPEMIQKARANVAKSNFKNIEFRLGEIENLPVDDNTVDVIISNCVINLVPDKVAAFKQAFRVLKPGGRLMVSDIVLVKELPDSIRKSVEAYVGCLAGAIMKDQYLHAISQAGFTSVEILEESLFPLDVMGNDPTAQGILDRPEVSDLDTKDAVDAVRSIKVSARKES